MLPLPPSLKSHFVPRASGFKFVPRTSGLRTLFGLLVILCSPSTSSAFGMRKSIVTLRFALYGCKNRPFFYIVATNRLKPRNRGYLEQVGTFDPMPNTRNEKLASLNMDRIRYWLSVGARPSRPVATLLGVAGVLPPHPHSLVVAGRNREALAAGALTSDVLEGAENDEEAPEES